MSSISTEKGLWHKLLASLSSYICLMFRDGGVRDQFPISLFEPQWTVMIPFKQGFPWVSSALF